MLSERDQRRLRQPVWERPSTVRLLPTFYLKNFNYNSLHSQEILKLQENLVQFQEIQNFMIDTHYLSEKAKIFLTGGRVLSNAPIAILKPIPSLPRTF